MTNFTMTGVSARKTLGAVVAASVIIALSACGVDDGKAQAEPDAQPSTAAITSATATATPSATAKTGVKAGDAINGLPTKTELANDGKGDYIQTTIAPDDPALTYNPAIVSQEEPSLFSEEEIKDAQKFVMTFLAEEGFDSILNDNPSDPKVQDAWWAKNKDKIDPSYQAELLADLKANDPNKPMVFRGQFRQDRANKYNLVHGSDATRVYSRKITPNEIVTGVRNGQKLIGIHSDVEFSMNAVVDGKTVVEATSGTAGYTVTQSPEGKWLITGYKSNYTTMPVVG